MCIMFLKVNYFAADKNESTIWRFSINEEVCMQKFCLYAKFRITELRIIPNNSLHSSLVQSFINKSLLVQDPNVFFSKIKRFEKAV